MQRPNRIALPLDKNEAIHFITLLEKELTYQLLLIQKYKDPLHDSMRIYEQHKRVYDRLTAEKNALQKLFDQFNQ